MKNVKMGSTLLATSTHVGEYVLAVSSTSDLLLFSTSYYIYYYIKKISPYLKILKLNDVSCSFSINI